MVLPSPRAPQPGVLVVDDHHWAGTALAESFRRRGWLAWTAATPLGVQQSLREDRPAVCLLQERLLQDWGPARTAALVGDATHLAVLATVGAAGLDARARQAGAKGLLHPHRDLWTTVTHVEALARTGALPLPTMTRDGGTRPAPRPRSSNPFARLSSRQRSVLALLCEGAGTDDIADELGISVTTARTHVQRLLAALGVHSRLEAVALVRRPDVERRGASAP